MKKQYEESSGNVFKDLGLKNPYSEQMRAELALEFFRILKKKKITQVQAAKLLGLKQPHLSRLKNGDYTHFSIESLLRFLNKLNKKVEIKILERKKGQKYHELSFVE
jgi:predicted XRE-type DNA-binding protein